VIRLAAVVIILYLAGAMTFGGLRVTQDWAEEVDITNVTLEVLEEGLSWPVTLLEWLDLV
jgi:hypothetical protein